MQVLRKCDGLRMLHANRCIVSDRHTWRSIHIGQTLGSSLSGSPGVCEGGAPEGGLHLIMQSLWTGAAFYLCPCSQKSDRHAALRHLQARLACIVGGNVLQLAGYAICGVPVRALHSTVACGEMYSRLT